MNMPGMVSGGADPHVTKINYKRDTAKRAGARAAEIARFQASLPGKMSADERDALFARLAQKSFALNRKLQFVVKPNSEDVIVKIIDGNTDKVLKVLPPEELQRLRDGIDKIVGTLLDKKA